MTEHDAADLWETEAMQSMDALIECAGWTNFESIFQVWRQFCASGLKWLEQKMELEDVEIQGGFVDWSLVYAQRKAETLALAALADSLIAEGRQNVAS